MSSTHVLIRVFALLLLSLKSPLPVSDTSPWLDWWRTYVLVCGLSLLFVFALFRIVYF